MHLVHTLEVIRLELVIICGGFLKYGHPKAPNHGFPFTIQPNNLDDFGVPLFQDTSMCSLFHRPPFFRLFLVGLLRPCLVWRSPILKNQIFWTSLSLESLARHDQENLLGGLEYGFYFSIQLGISSSQLTNSYFSEGQVNHQPVKWIVKVTETVGCQCRLQMDFPWISQRSRFFFA